MPRWPICLPARHCSFGMSTTGSLLAYPQKPPVLGSRDPVPQAPDGKSSKVCLLLLLTGKVWYIIIFSSIIHYCNAFYNRFAHYDSSYLWFVYDLGEQILNNPLVVKVDLNQSQFHISFTVFLNSDHPSWSMHGYLGRNLIIYFEISHSPVLIEEKFHAKLKLEIIANSGLLVSWKNKLALP